MRVKTVFLCLFAVVFTISSQVRGEMLLNGGFEDGGPIPTYWSNWGDGSYIIRTDDYHGGARCMELGGGDLAVLYQRVAGGAAEQGYTVSVWAKEGSGANNGELKVEFHNEWENKITEIKHGVTGTSEWEQHFVSGIAPVGTYYVTATVVGFGGSTVLFDDVSLVEASGSDSVTFDVSDRRQKFDGFGAQIWGYGPDTNYPNLLTYREQALSELNIKYVRIENYAEWASWDDMVATRAVTDALGIEWVYMIWIAPAEFMDATGMLRDTKIEDFAIWWAGHVGELYSEGIDVEYIELMNEPDSGGSWSTGITATQYNTLVNELRPRLDAAGLGDVGIVGPGLASMTWSDPSSYIYALDSTGVDAMGVWSTHAWGGDVGGPSGLEYSWLNFGPAADAQDANLPKFVTEYSTHERIYNGVTYPHADSYGSWDTNNVFPYFSVTNCMGYAVRVFGNTLGLLNSGANSAFVWQAIDEPTEVNPPGYDGSKRKSWGLLDLWGEAKPVYGALKTLYPKIPIGAEVIGSPSQTANFMYSGALVYGNKIILGVSNERSTERSSTIYLENAPANLEVKEAVAFEQVYWGDAGIGEPDIGAEAAKTLTIVDEGGGSYSLEVTLAAGSTLTVVLSLEGDITVDGFVDNFDLAVIAERWLDDSCGDCGGADISGDEKVNMEDFAEMGADWGNL